MTSACNLALGERSTLGECERAHHWSAGEVSGCVDQDDPRLSRQGPAARARAGRLWIPPLHRAGRDRLVKIRTLAEPGVPLARIRELKAAPDDAVQAALADIDRQIGERIRTLRLTRRRLRELASGRVQLLPDDVEVYLERLGTLGFSDRWI